MLRQIIFYLAQIWRIWRKMASGKVREILPPKGVYLAQSVRGTKTPFSIWRKPTPCNKTSGSLGGTKCAMLARAFSAPTTSFRQALTEAMA